MGFSPLKCPALSSLMVPATHTLHRAHPRWGRGSQVARFTCGTARYHDGGAPNVADQDRDRGTERS